jgi:hypothetical protein
MQSVRLENGAEVIQRDPVEQSIKLAGNAGAKKDSDDPPIHLIIDNLPLWPLGAVGHPAANDPRNTEHLRICQGVGLAD